MSRLEAYNHLADAGGPILNALAQMSEADQNYVIAACLRVTYDPTNKAHPEMWDPATGAWSQMAPMAIPRTYHSVALLLPDGRVFSGGGGLCGTCTTTGLAGSPSWTTKELTAPTLPRRQRPAPSPASPVVVAPANASITARTPARAPEPSSA